MKVTLTNITASIVDTKSYVDIKTGNKRERVVATIGGFIGSEMVSATIYGQDKSDFDGLPKVGGSIIIDCYKYESNNALMGNVYGRGWSSLK